MLAVFAAVRVKVSVPAACAVHTMPAAAYALADAGAGATMTLLLAVTPVALTVMLSEVQPLVPSVHVVVDMLTPPLEGSAHVPSLRRNVVVDEPKAGPFVIFDALSSLMMSLSPLAIVGAVAVMSPPLVMLPWACEDAALLVSVGCTWSALAYVVAVPTAAVPSMLGVVLDGSTLDPPDGSAPVHILMPVPSCQ